MEEDIDFEEQLKLEAIEKQKRENIAAGTYTDKDGTVFEWDADKKAWFPKIDDDFIAKYQMNYGTTEATTTETTESSENKETPQNSDQYDSDYWNYYNQYYQTQGQSQNPPDKAVTDGDQKSDGDETESDGAQNEADIDSEEYYKQYYDDYYKQYYDDYYNEYYQKYYQSQGQTQNPSDKTVTDGDQKSDGAEKTESGAEKEADINSEGYYKQYYDDYYKQYYDDYYTQYYDEHYSENAADGKDEEDEGEEQGNGKRKGKKKGQKRKLPPKPPEDPKWFDMDETKNTNVYVSGLPTDITEDEFKELMQKFGLVMFDPRTKKPKLKLYTDENGQPKGDARCCYIKLESVDLALKILDGYDLRDHKLHVEKAKFTMKGNFDPAKKKKKLTNKEKRKLKEKQEKLFDWRPERQSGTRLKCEKVVILKNMFSPSEFDEDPMLINELRDDVRNESSKFGEVKNVKIFDNHPEGVMTVSFKTAEEADACIEALNGRWFAKKRISAESWDGRTKYEIQESEAERDQRLQKWETFLEDDSKKEKATSENVKTETKDVPATFENSADNEGPGASGSSQIKDETHISPAPTKTNMDSSSKDGASGAESMNTG